MNKGDYLKLIQNPSFLSEMNEFLLFETRFVYLKIPGGYVAPPGHSNYDICSVFQNHMSRNWHWRPNEQGVIPGQHRSHSGKDH